MARQLRKNGAITGKSSNQRGAHSCLMNAGQYLWRNVDRRQTINIVRQKNQAGRVARA
jgi:hypothetical protein